MFILQLLSAFFTPCLLHITSSDFISVHPGENITLLCNITDYPEILWYQLRSDEVKLLISAEQGLLEKTFSLSYNVNKSHFDPTESSSSVSLVIIGVRETDLGFYYCGGRNDDKHIQFGKLIRLNFNITDKPHEQHNHSNFSGCTDTQQSTETRFWITMSVCVASVLLNLICMCVFCYRLKGKSVSSCSSSTDAPEKVPEMFYYYKVFK
ncbi:hypothetical protein HF521_001792 [Silurus meridionalis]|uniref:Ig-like domain-containing protein n=1 Tax=Silurus meridionalis TaxID=175797 RepID=A0A8T0B7G9_SILME|nr:hypothetical protein HF521_001792 [Silurus meridionalis]